MTRLIPTSALALLFRDWPLAQILVLQAFLYSPPSIRAALGMAHDEMQNIRDLELTLLEEHRGKLWFYFADHDDWVGGERNSLLRSLKSDVDVVRVVHGHHDIPHAFCISKGSTIPCFNPGLTRCILQIIVNISLNNVISGCAGSMKLTISRH